MSSGIPGSVAVAAALGLGMATGLGVLMTVRGVMRRAPGRSAWSLWWHRRPVVPPAWRGRRLGVALAAGVAAGALTGWPVLAVLIVVAAVALPDVLAPDRAAAQMRERMEAVAVWAEMLRDTLSAAAGLEQAVLASAEVAPPALRPQIQALAARVRAGQPLAKALRALASEADDPLADLVVAALVTAAERQAKHLGALLGELAEAVREHVAMRQRIEAGRASVRTSVRVVCGVTLGMAAGLVVLNRAYLRPFDTSLGQLALALVGLLFAASFAWLHSIARMQSIPRILGVPAARQPAAEEVTVL